VADKQLAWDAVLGGLLYDRLCAEAGLGEQPQPQLTPEQPGGVSFLHCLCPPPLPSSSTVRTGIEAELSRVAASSASSSYSSGGEINGHQPASSP